MVHSLSLLFFSKRRTLSVDMHAKKEKEKKQRKEPLLQLTSKVIGHLLSFNYRIQL
jgi:hypothetical protein